MKRGFAVKHTAAEEYSLTAVAACRVYGAESMSSTPIAPDRISVCAQSPSPVQVATGTQTGGEKSDVTKSSVAPGIQPPEGHDRDYHLKKADGSPDHHIPLIKSLLARPDISLHEVLVYGLLFDMLGQNHTYCCPTQAEIADTLKISVRSVVRAMASLRDKGLVATVFVGDRNQYYLPDRGICSLEVQR
jgi:hypothetical protein